ncbi:MAG: tRNA uridine-5-carboxymethylaminomethyl(34) synthesis GTPase MnmE [Fimbriimonadaceae bacterium]
MSEVGAWTETIAACITAPGRGAVAIVRLSGSKSLDIARIVAPFLPQDVVYRHAYFGDFETGDDGLCLVFAEGASFTGELVVELNCHGSPISVNRLLEACYAAGARAAERGEFSLRAFLNGVIDLSEAEGIRETVDAMTDRQFDRANQLRVGMLAREIGPILEDVRHGLTTVEALTDFSEELGEFTFERKTERLFAALEGIDKFLSSEALSRRIKEGLLVVLAGRPNAGKSSLLNALLKADRAIVTAIAGTTRDAIEEQIAIDGIPVRLVDTAGLRESNDEVEQHGIRRSEQYMRDADLVLYLFDGSAGWTAEDERLFEGIGERGEVLATKADLGRSERGIAVSVVSGEGIELVIEHIRSRIENGATEPVTLVDRHYSVMHEVQNLVQESIDTLRNDSVPDDLAAVTLRGALRKLGELTGESASADVLEQIFSQFCIGK